MHPRFRHLVTDSITNVTKHFQHVNNAIKLQYNRHLEAYYSKHLMALLMIYATYFPTIILFLLSVKIRIAYTEAISNLYSPLASTSKRIIRTSGWEMSANSPIKQHSPSVNSISCA